MIRLRTWWRALRNIAIFVSVIFNIIFIFVLFIVIILIFDLNRGLIKPLVNGLDRSFYGLDSSEIITTIKVNDIVPVKLNIPIQSNTIVKLTGPVPVRANATFNLPGGGGTINGSVNITLPTGLELPVALSLNVGVDDTLPIALNVPVNIKIKDTQLTVPVNELRRTLNNLVLVFNNLPDNWGEFWPFMARVLTGRAPNLLAPNKQSLNPWPDFGIAVSTPLAPGAARPTAIGGTPDANLPPPNGTPNGFPPAQASPQPTTSGANGTNGTNGGLPVPATTLTPAPVGSGASSTPRPAPITATTAPTQPAPGAPATGGTGAGQGAQPTPTGAADLGIIK